MQSQPHRTPFLYRVLVLRIESDQHAALDILSSILRTSTKYGVINKPKNHAIIKAIKEITNTVERAQIISILLATNKDFVDALVQHASGQLQVRTEIALRAVLTFYKNVLCSYETDNPGVILERVARTIALGVIPEDVQEGIQQMQLPLNEETFQNH
jgi:hypothetical protein